MSTYIIYEWEAWDGYMLTKLLPDATRLRACPSDQLDQVLSHISENVSLFAFHLNCTRTELFPNCRGQLINELQSRGIAVLNAQVTDISKRSLQRACAFIGLPTIHTIQGNGPQYEKLIVKTNLNYGGYGESRLPESERLLLRLERKSSAIQGTNYHVVARSEIPESWWDDPDLVIERYIENPSGRKYRVYFAGSHFYVCISTDDRQLKKFDPEAVRTDYFVEENTLATALHAELPSSLQRSVMRIVRHMRLDFGALDLVEGEDGVCVIIDVNSTSYWRAATSKATDYLREGLLQRARHLHEDVSAPQIYMPNVFTVASYIDALSHRERAAEPPGWTPVPSSADEASLAVKSRPEAQQKMVDIEPAYRYRNAADLAIVVPLFNLSDSSRKLMNFAFVSGLLNSSGIATYVIECAQANQSWLLQPAPTVFRVRATGELWQKERLINYVLPRIPEQYTKIAWIDADVLFENADWPLQASDSLNHLAVVQLFHKIIRLPPGHISFSGSGNVWESFAEVYARSPNALLNGDFGTHGHTGFAWAARREVLTEVGLYDACIAGGADHIMAHVFCGDWESSCLTNMMGNDTPWYRHAVKWAQRVYPLVNARVGVVRGHALHLWHGNMQTREHVRRYRPLLNNSYDPEQDIYIDANGCWAFQPSKSEITEALSRYLASRRCEGS